MRKKHIKIEVVRSLFNVFSCEDENPEERINVFFGNNNPVTMEIGCGHGNYTTALAQRYPDRNFIGVDLKSSRIYTASKLAESGEVKNACFLISRAEFLPDIFTTLKIEEIWVTFPDTHPRRKSSKRRLISPEMLDIYKKFTTPDALINLKTDDDDFYQFALETVQEGNYDLLKAYENVYENNDLTDEEKIQTKYEKDHLAKGRTIKLLSFRFKA